MQKKRSFQSIGKQTVHLLSRNLLSTGAVIALMGVATFAAAPTGGYAPGATLDPDCSPGDTDCAVTFSQDPNKFVDGTTTTDAVFTGGNVGIGTNSPTDALHVANGAGFFDAMSTNEGGEIQFAYSSGAIDSGKYYIDAYKHPTDTSIENILRFRSAQNSNIMNITNTGNVGIGTTAPSEKLEINGKISITDGSNLSLKIKTFDSGEVGLSPMSDIDTTGGDSTSENMVRFFRSTNTTGRVGVAVLKGNNSTTPNAFIAGNGDSYLANNNGNVGIGTTLPAGKLDVEGGLFSHGEYVIGQDANNTTTYIRSKGGTSTQGGGINLHNEDHATYANDIHLLGETAYISGNVGIGTTAPDRKLVIGTSGVIKFSDVNNIGTDADILFKQGGSIASEDGLNLTAGANGTPDSVIFRTGAEGSTSSTETMRITGAGNVGIGTTSPSQKLHINGTALATAWNTTSDERKKTNIKVLDNVLDKISQIRGVYFDWKDSGESTVGVIAQDVEKVYPEFVTTDSEGYKSIDYSKLVAPLIESVKALKAENNTTNERNDALELQIEKLELRLSALEK